MLKTAKRLLPKRTADSLRWLAGHFVGSRVTLDGCTFDVNLPQISRRAKAAFLFDRYERGLREAVQRFVSPDLPIIELGGGLGVVSCIVNKRLRNPSQHIVLEANPAMVSAIQRQRALNDCQFDIVHGAIAYDVKTVTLDIADSFLSTRVNGTGASVPAVSLKALTLQLGVPQPFTLICDIEGAEAALFNCDWSLITHNVHTLILETHPHITGQAFITDLQSRLRLWGFKALQTTGEILVYRRA